MAEPRGAFTVVTLPAWSVYALGALMVGIAAAIPFLARWQGLLHGPAPALPAHEPRWVRPVMLRLPGGEFRMGSPDGEEGRFGDEGPRRRVRISAFEICATEVTQAQWEAVMGTTPSNCRYGCGDDVPVHDVSWLEAIEYLNRLADLEGLSRCYARTGDTVTWERTCTGYRLPTEAEWEYAARAGSETAYSFGHDASRLGEYAWYDENSGEQAHPVAQKRPNAWGLHDVHGNVWEWVWDWYAPYPPEPEPVSDPAGPAEADAPVVDTYDVVDGELKEVKGKARLLRGGSFVFWAENLRSAYRYWVRPTVRVGSGGFRCARGGAQHWPFDLLNH